MSRTKKRTKLSNEALRVFVIAWTQAAAEGRNQQWIADQLHISRATVYRRGKYLRSRGVRLPKLQPSTNTVNVNELNGLIKSNKKPTTWETLRRSL